MDRYLQEIAGVPDEHQLTLLGTVCSKAIVSIFIPR